MFKTLFVYYNKNMSIGLKQKFDIDFNSADKILLISILIVSMIVAFVTSWQHGYYKLGIVGGSVISAVCFIAYKTMQGTAMCRLIMATALVGLLAITVQQSNGLGEGHFLFFLGFTILIRYRDFMPLLVFLVLTVLHHLSFTYCQSIGVDLWGQPITIFSWGDQTELGLIAPLVYHVIIAVIALIVSTYYIYEGNKQFVESNLVIGAVERATQGDLSTQIDNNDVDSLLVEQVNSFLQRLHSTFTQINQVTDTLSIQANETSQSAQSRAKHAGEQQNEVGQVVAAVTQMTAATQEIAGTAERTALASNETVETSEVGGKLANTCHQSITELALHVSKASDIISELDRNSQQISSIVQTISSIAEQTNLLALNAAIEAARAGEQGRGFAVVADEVRVLSQRTHSSTEEITKMISTLQSSTQSAVQNMEGCHALASTSVHDADKATQSFASIAITIRKISDMATQIATAAEAQSSVTEEMNRNTSTINDVSEQFFVDAEKSRKEASDLLRQAQSMGELVKHFRLS
ncbi:MAG: methyl-accepting chemotaxis protein [Oceanicoccus sp.]|jgi:methyl-accepting chemotaxis protein